MSFTSSKDFKIEDFFKPDVATDEDGESFGGLNTFQYIYEEKPDIEESMDHIIKIEFKKILCQSVPIIKTYNYNATTPETPQILDVDTVDIYCDDQTFSFFGFNTPDSIKISRWNDVIVYNNDTDVFIFTEQLGKIKIINIAYNNNNRESIETFIINDEIPFQIMNRIYMSRIDQLDKIISIPYFSSTKINRELYTESKNVIITDYLKNIEDQTLYDPEKFRTFIYLLREASITNANQ